MKSDKDVEKTEDQIEEEKRKQYEAMMQGSIFEREPIGKWEEFLFWFTGFHWKWSLQKPPKNMTLLSSLKSGDKKETTKTSPLATKNKNNEDLAALLEGDDIFAALTSITSTEEEEDEKEKDQDSDEEDEEDDDEDVGQRRREIGSEFALGDR